tara:strand:- start:135 stop:461 length:327 start_codon:yes stop_codon:yes gene_type:complete
VIFFLPRIPRILLNLKKEKKERKKQENGMYAGEYGNHAFTIVLIWSKVIRVWPNHDVILLCIGTQKSSGSSYQHHRIHRNQSWKNNDEVYVLRPGSVQLVRRGGVHRR